MPVNPKHKSPFENSVALLFLFVNIGEGFYYCVYKALHCYSRWHKCSLNIPYGMATNSPFSPTAPTLYIYYSKEFSTFFFCWVKKWKKFLKLENFVSIKTFFFQIDLCHLQQGQAKSCNYLRQISVALFHYTAPIEFSDVFRFKNKLTKLFMSFEVTLNHSSIATQGVALKTL